MTLISPDLTVEIMYIRFRGKADNQPLILSVKFELYTLKCIMKVR